VGAGSGFNRDFSWIISVGVKIVLVGGVCGSGGGAAAVGLVFYCSYVVVIV
jgi:hypothetical protein